MWILTLLFGGWLKTLASELWGLVIYHTKDVLLAVLAVATFWLWTDLKAEKAKHHSDLVAMWAASDENRAATEAQRAVERAAAKLEAQNAQNDFEAAQPAVDDATDRHVADWLRSGPPGICPSRTVSETGAPSIREDVPPDPRLAEGAAAMRGLAAASTYAVKLRDWALVVTGLKAAPAPLPEPTVPPKQKEAP